MSVLADSQTSLSVQARFRGILLSNSEVCENLAAPFLIPCRLCFRALQFRFNWGFSSTGIPPNSILVTLDTECHTVEVLIHCISFSETTQMTLPPAQLLLQTKGTAKGSTFAPNYANFYVGIENRYVLNAEVNSFFTHIFTWYRFLMMKFLLIISQYTLHELGQFYIFSWGKKKHII